MVFQNSPNIFVAIVQIKLYGCQATGHTGLIRCQRTCVKLVQVNTSHQHRHPITLLMTKLVAGSRLGCNSREAAIWTLCEMLWKALFGWWKRAGFDVMWTKLRLLASHKNLGLLISFLLGSICRQFYKTCGPVIPVYKVVQTALTKFKCTLSCSICSLVFLSRCAPLHFNATSVWGFCNKDTILHLEIFTKTDFLWAAICLLVNFMTSCRSSPIFVLVIVLY